MIVKYKVSDFAKDLNLSDKKVLDEVFIDYISILNSSFQSANSFEGQYRARRHPS